MYSNERAGRTQERDQGFTLIELLVVMIIIGILAAIAIPTFLNQRQNGYKTAVKNDLRNSATAVESKAVGFNGAYNNASVLPAAGALPVALNFVPSQGVTINAALASTANDFCLWGVNSNASSSYFIYKKSAGGLQTTEYATSAAAITGCGALVP